MSKETIENVIDCLGAVGFEHFRKELIKNKNVDNYYHKIKEYCDFRNLNFDLHWEVLKETFCMNPNISILPAERETEQLQDILEQTVAALLYYRYYRTNSKCQKLIDKIRTFGLSLKEERIARLIRTFQNVE